MPERILLAGAVADPAYSREYAQEVLVGNMARKGTP
jgi:hypothetical protein